MFQKGFAQRRRLAEGYAINQIIRVQDRDHWVGPLDHCLYIKSSTCRTKIQLQGVQGGSKEEKKLDLPRQKRWLHND